MAGRLYGTEGFQPRKIIFQILLMQIVFYVGYFSWLTVLHFLFGTPVDIKLVLSYTAITTHTSYGWAAIMSMFVAGIVASYGMGYIVERAKKCADFTFTLYFWHTVFSICYGGFPIAWDWWVVHLVSMIVTGLLGEHFCMRREMEDISVDQIVARRSSQDSKKQDVSTKAGNSHANGAENRNGSSAAAAASAMPYKNGTVGVADLSHHQVSADQQRDLEKQPLLQKNDSDVDLRSGMDTKHKVIPETDGAGSGASARTRRTAATGESEVPASGPSPSKDRRSSSSGGIDTASEPQSMFEKLKSRWPGVTRAFGVSTADGRESPPS
eukprot:gb/GECG01016815.1/.p1 GENE.gb/GECG01016815.1/~~gb/GECG01016815.1/.p1  ORF type:complete len:325 (+),score=38.19 gb/GECG01016815.1/:1-975(+)